MQIVYKYALKNEDLNAVKVPFGAKVLKIAFQASPYGMGFKVWILHNHNAPAEDTKYFRIVVTGEIIKELVVEHHGSFEPNGILLHIFEVKPIGE